MLSAGLFHFANFLNKPFSPGVCSLSAHTEPTVEARAFVFLSDISHPQHLLFS